MGWKQYSRPLWLSRTNYYILYLKAITALMLGRGVVFPQRPHLAYQYERIRLSELSQIGSFLRDLIVLNVPFPALKRWANIATPLRG